MDFLIDAAFQRAKVTFMALVIVVITGLTAFATMPREADPDVTLPFVLVFLPLPGVSPEDAESLLIKPAESELQGLEGLKQMDALAFEGAAQIVLEFEIETDIDVALTDVRTAIDRARTDFPPDAREPVIEEFNAQTLFPILSIVLSGEVPERTLLRLARELQDRLLALDGTLDAELVGDREEVLEISVAPEVLENYNLSELEIAEAIRNSNSLITAGSIRFADGNFPVKVPGLIRSVEDARAVPVRSDGNGVILLGDIAEVRLTFEDSAGYALFQGETAIGINLSKRAGANIIELTEAARAEAAALSASWPETVHVNYLGDQSSFVKTVLDGLTSSIILAILLVMIVLIAVLGLRSALMVGVAIPSSFLMGLAFLNLNGFTLNMMVMFAMVLAVGMLVDGAIVIVEFADRRMAEGESRRLAYAESAKRMFWPITASTATTLAAFVPLLFWNSVEGKFMSNLPQTLIYVLCSSLVVALIFLPLIGAYAGLPDWWKKLFHVRGRTDEATATDLDNVDPRKMPGLTGFYARNIDRATLRPLLVIFTTIAILWMCQKEFALSDPAIDFFLDPDSEQAIILVQGRGNMSEEQKRDIALEVQERIAGHPAVEFLYTRTGSGLAREQGMPPDVIAQVTVDLIDFGERKHSLKILEDFRGLLKDIPGILTEVRPPPQGPDTGKDVQVVLSGRDFAQVELAAAELRRIMQSDTTKIGGVEVPTFMDFEDTLPLPGTEFITLLDREEASRQGASLGQVGAKIQLVTEGLLADSFRPDGSDEEVDIRIRFPQEHRRLGSLEKLTIQTATGPVPASNFVKFEPRHQVDKLTRRDGIRIVEVKANANISNPQTPVSQNTAIAAAKAIMESGVLATVTDAPVDWKLGGASEQTEEAAAFFEGAMLAALALIGAILLMQFNSFYHAALTLSAVVMAVFGVLLGLAFVDTTISFLMVGIGIFALAGIVVNNNIVLIDTYQHLRRTGLEIREAAVRAAAQRMRPVLLTSFTTMLGLLPMVYAINVDFAHGQISRGSEVSDWWIILSYTIVVGLGFATLLTLIVTPVMLAAPVTFRNSVRGLVGWTRNRLGLAGNRGARQSGSGKVPGAPGDEESGEERPFKDAAE